MFPFKFVCRDDSDDITDTACVSDSGDGKTVTCKQKTDLHRTKVPLGKIIRH